MKQHFLLVLVTCLLSLTACTSDDWTGAGGNGENAIRFSAYTTALKPGSGAHTRNAETNPASLKASGFGIMAYQSVGDYDPSAASTEFYMEDQQVTWNGSAWTYSPTKYWPAGNSHKLSFFAYGPYGATGVSLVKDSKEPKLSVALPPDQKKTVDLVTAATRNLGSDQSSSPVTFTFKHVMAAVKMKAKASADLTGNGQVQLHVTGLKLKHTDKLPAAGTYHMHTGNWGEFTGYLSGIYDLGDAANGILNRDPAIDAVDVSDAAGVDLFGTNTLYLIPINGVTGSAAEGEVQAEVSFKLRTRSDGISNDWVESSKTLTVNFPARGFKQGSLTSYTFTIGLNEIKVSADITETKTELITGNYTGALGDVSRIVIDNTWTYDVKKTSTNQYSIEGLTDFPASGTVSVYIKDNQEDKEVLLLTTSKGTFDPATGLLTLNLSPGGMEGKGTETEPYQVTTAAQLRGVSCVSDYTYYKQTQDIDLSIYSNWTCLSNTTKSNMHAFYSRYDGGHYQITNLKQTPETTGGGLFNENFGVIQNVHVSGNIQRNGNIGGICSTCRGTECQILSCSSAVNITSEVLTGKGERYVGGIVGHVNGGCPIYHCKNTGNISGYYEVCGGIVGYVYNGVKIEFCYNTGNISPTTIYAGGGTGGIVGAIFHKPLLKYCYNTGTISTPTSYDAGRYKSGGIIAVAQGNDVTAEKITENYSISSPIGSSLVTEDDNYIFNSVSAWPAYSEVSTNGWGSAHWKPYAMGEYPKLLWEK